MSLLQFLNREASNSSKLKGIKRPASKEQAPPQALYFQFEAPWTGALVIGVSLCALALFGVYTKLGPISREAELRWLCSKWKGANPEPGTKWEKAKEYKKLKAFTRSQEAFRFCDRGNKEILGLGTSFK